MSAGLSFWIFLVLVCGSSEGLNITAEPGENVILTCETGNKYSLIILEWNREGLGEKKIFLFLGGRPFLPYDHESYKNRVFPKNSQRKDGDLSVVLKNLTIDDSGTYVCKAVREDDPQRELKLISTVHLSVEPSDVPSPGLNITAEPGENVILTCETENDDDLIFLEWNLEGFGKEEAVFVYRDGRPYPSAQHESFRNRVFLINSRKVEDGDLSVVLKNVTINDNGTYECRVLKKRTKRSILETQPISTVRLSVLPPGDREQLGGDKDGEKNGGMSRVPIGVVLSVLLGVVPAVGLWIYRKKNSLNQSSSGSNHEKEIDPDRVNADSDPNKKNQIGRKNYT